MKTGKGLSSNISKLLLLTVAAVFATYVISSFAGNFYSFPSENSGTFRCSSEAIHAENSHHSDLFIASDFIEESEENTHSEEKSKTNKVGSFPAGAGHSICPSCLKGFSYSGKPVILQARKTTPLYVLFHSWKNHSA